MGPREYRFSFLQESKTTAAPDLSVLFDGSPYQHYRNFPHFYGDIPTHLRESFRLNCEKKKSLLQVNFVQRPEKRKQKPIYLDKLNTCNKYEVKYWFRIKNLLRNHILPLSHLILYVFFQCSTFFNALLKHSFIIYF